MGSSISKAFKKVVNNALGSVGLDKDPAAPTMAPVPVAATPVEVPNEKVDDVDTETTPTDEKKTKRVGKRGLQVSRSSGSGISI